jgi:hypothetical protein
MYLLLADFGISATIARTIDKRKTSVGTPVYVNLIFKLYVCSIGWLLRY